MGDWKAFGREIIGYSWDAMEIDTEDVHELAVKHGILRKVPFESAKHENDTSIEYDVQNGDPWLEYTDEKEAELDQCKARLAEIEAQAEDATEFVLAGMLRDCKAELKASDSDVELLHDCLNDDARAYEKLEAVAKELAEALGTALSVDE